MSCDTGGPVIRFLKAHRMWNHLLCHRPQPAAAMYHSLRVYYHVMYWKGKGDSMKPEEWGWHIVDGKCLPMQTDKPAAPAELLDIISCSCKTLCNTKRCTCRQHGLQCSDVCTECRGASCSNSELPGVPNDCMD